jgi:hypothetical protein
MVKAVHLLCQLELRISVFPEHVGWRTSPGTTGVFPLSQDVLKYITFELHLNLIVHKF